ncbi:MAG: hypothetical protein K2K96_13185 [Lachnospiraceae bacterium]|nr:hypothetical protein [Lachnospiraceae bacterium]
MKKPVLLISSMCLVLTLTACYGNTEKENDNVSNQNMQESNVEEASQSSEEIETPSDTSSNEDENEIEADTTIASEEIASDAINNEIDMDHLPINWGTSDGPEIAAENYYRNTVFELVSLEVLQYSKEYVLFSVVSKKGGELVDPNRTIELRYEDGAWNVVNEGY